MRIKNNSIVEFKDINLAQVFEYAGELYMKIPEVDCCDDDTLDGDGEGCNAVSLRIGVLIRLVDCEPVKIVDAVLTICS